MILGYQVVKIYRLCRVKDSRRLFIDFYSVTCR